MPPDVGCRAELPEDGCRAELPGVGCKAPPDVGARLPLKPGLVPRLGLGDGLKFVGCVPLLDGKEFGCWTDVGPKLCVCWAGLGVGFGVGVGILSLLLGHPVDKRLPRHTRPKIAPDFLNMTASP
jgi:hypothetical protein